MPRKEGEPVFNLRLSADLRDALYQRATKNRRSANSELLVIIERLLETQEIIVEGAEALPPLISIDELPVDKATLGNEAERPRPHKGAHKKQG